MVGGCRPNVVDGPVSWREVPGGGRAGAGKEGGGVAAAGEKGIAGLRRPFPRPPPRPGRAPAAGPRKFFRNCPCIGGGVPV